MIKSLEIKHNKGFKDFNPCLVGKKIKGNVLIFHDEGDRASEVENSKKLTEVIPKSVLKISQGLGHNKILKDEGTIKDVLSFLSRTRKEKKKLKSLKINFIHF